MKCHSPIECALTLFCTGVILCALACFLVIVLVDVWDLLE